MRSKAFAPYGGREIPIALPARQAPPPNKRPFPTPQRSRRTPPKLADHANNRAHDLGAVPLPRKREEEAGRVRRPRRFHFTETCSRTVSHSTSQLERAMSIPKPLYNPPFNVTRASHSVLSVKDLAVSRNFYVDLLGFIVSDEDRDALYLRAASPRRVITVSFSNARAASRRPSASACASSATRIWRRPRRFSTKPACRRHGSRSRTRAAPSMPRTQA